MGLEMVRNPFQLTVILLAVAFGTRFAFALPQAQARITPKTAPTAVVKTTIPFADARPILEGLRDDLLPLEMQNRTSDERRRLWPVWVRRHDAEIHERVDRGDDDSLANFFLFGTSFSTASTNGAPANASTDWTPATPLDQPDAQRRLDAMVSGMAMPGANERLQFARTVVERAGINPSTAQGRVEARQYLVAIITRMLSERERYEQALKDRPLDFAKQSTLFSIRGLSADTSLLPNFAIDRTLSAIEAKKLLAASTVRRVAVVGPGLDFMNKKGGYDFYPQQTLQPFAIVDSLRRLGIAAANVRVTTFDLSRRVNHHLELARQRAQAGEGYILRLIRDLNEPWSDELIVYSKQFGDTIGAQAAVTVPADVTNVEARAVRVNPATVLSIEPQDVNIVLERPVAPAAEPGFDLIVGTNIFLYYDVFEQSLALANVSKMLRPGGLLLSNDFLNPLPTIPLNLVGFTDVAYSPTSAGSGDRVFWYQRQ